MTHFFLKKLPYFLLSLPLAVLLLLGWQLGQFSPGVPTDTPTGEYHGSRITDLRVVQYKGQRLAWTLEAPQAINQNDGSVDFDQPRFLLYPPKGGETRGQAEKGWVSEKGDLVTFQQDVLLSDDKHRQLMTKSLQFEPEQGILYSDQAFQWRDGDLYLEGVGFRLHQKDRQLQVTRAVHAIFTDSPQKASQGEK